MQAHQEEGLPPARQSDADYLSTVKGSGRQHTADIVSVSKGKDPAQCTGAAATVCS